MGFLEKWRPSLEMDCFRGEFDDLLERFGMDRDWLSRWPFDRKFFGDWQSLPPDPRWSHTSKEVNSSFVPIFPASIRRMSRLRWLAASSP